MGSLFFFFKSIALTFFIIILLQIRIGPQTLEERALSWARQSSLVQPVESVAQGAVLLVQNLWGKATTRTTQATQRRLELKLERSSQYLKSQAQELYQGSTDFFFQEDQLEQEP